MFHHNVTFLQIFAKGKTNSSLYKCILVFLHFMDRGFLRDDLTIIFVILRWLSIC